MTSNVTEAFVWIWLPGSTVPVVAGRIEKLGALHHFTYGRSYRERDDAIALSPFELWVTAIPTWLPMSWIT
jgi:serine/threonine-protein kinase HipA